MKVSRLELLQYEMAVNMVAMADEEYKLADKFLNQECVDTLKAQAGILGMSVGSSQAIKAQMDGVINTPFKNVTWSERIWSRQEALRGIVQKATADLVLRGKNPTLAIPQLRKEFDVSVYEAKRLAVTEGARMQMAVQKASFEQMGFEEYEYISEPGACAICRPLDGKHFKVADMQSGWNASPMHPFCRCSTAAHYTGREKVAKIDEKIYNQGMSNTDYMAISKQFVVGNEVRVRAKQLLGQEYDIWVQDNTKKIRDTVANVSESLREIDNIKIPRIVVLKKSRIVGLAGYNQGEDILFVSDVLSSKEKIANALSTNYFVAKDMTGILEHELLHKRHWDSVKEFYKKNRKRYNSIEEAKADLDSPIISYVKQQLSVDYKYLSRISDYANISAIEGKYNEVIAEAMIADSIVAKDLQKKIKEVLKWK